MTLSQLIDEPILALLRRRDLVVSRPSAGSFFGRHTAWRGGRGSDFHDRRPYTPGDDIRRIDMRAAARLDRLVLRQHQAETERQLLIALDASAAMHYSPAKWRLAQQSAAVLAWLALRQNDPVGLVLGTKDGISDRCARPKRGNRMAHALAETIGSTTPTGLCPWNAIAAMLPQLAPHRSLMAVISDFLDPSTSLRSAESIEDEMFLAFERFTGMGHSVVLLQTLDRDELTFPWDHPDVTTFVDMRGIRPQQGGAPSRMRERYLERLHAHLAHLQRRCDACGVILARWVAQEPFGPQVSAFLERAAGLGTLL